MRPIIGITCPWSGDTWGPNERGGTYDYVGRAYSAAIYKAGGLPVLISAIAGESNPQDHARQLLQTVDGLYFTGGGDRTLRSVKPLPLYEQQPDRSQWEDTLLKLAYEQDVPCIGACRGHQMMAVALGGAMDPVRYPDHKQTLPYHMGIHDVIPSGLLADIIGSDPWFVNSIHVQRVKTLPDGFVEVAHTEDGSIEAMAATGKSFFLGTQFHPELMPEDPRSLAIFRKFIEVAVSRKNTCKK